MADTITKHFVTFYSPGTFVSEQTTKPVDTWDVNEAMAMARTVRERHGAIPYAFQFSTRERGPDDLDSREVRRSHLYYLGGRVETIEEVRDRADPNERILLSNMEMNDIKRIIVNDNSWRTHQTLHDDDVILEWTPPERETSHGG